MHCSMLFVCMFYCCMFRHKLLVIDVVCCAVNNFVDFCYPYFMHHTHTAIILYLNQDNLTSWFQAGIPSHKQTVILEPEAAAFYCDTKELEISQGTDGCLSLHQMSLGVKYLVVDLGGKWCLFWFIFMLTLSKISTSYLETKMQLNMYVFPSIHLVLPVLCLFLSTRK